MANNNPRGINQYTKGGGKISSLQKSRASIRKSMNKLAEKKGASLKPLRASMVVTATKFPNQRGKIQAHVFQRSRAK